MTPDEHRKATRRRRQAQTRALHAALDEELFPPEEERPMESWRTVWRRGFAPLLSREALEALREGLATDDVGLSQGFTTAPPPLQCVADWPVEAACALGYCGWKGEGLETVAEVEEFFARMCFEVDQRLGEPAACRYFLNFWDETPRAEARALLLDEVARALLDREEFTPALAEGA